MLGRRNRSHHQEAVRRLGAEVIAMSSWRVVGLCVLCISLCGCEEPSLIVQTAPPGYEPPPPPPSDKDKAEALGEAAVKGGSASVKPKVREIALAPPTAKGETKTTKSGVKYETLVEGSGREAKPGDTVRVHYTGTLESGKQFDSSRGGKEPFNFVIGAGGVIEGWDEGIAGMHVGERRKLTIPPAAAYGELAKENIPPNSTLIFDVELMGVDKNSPD
jgi:FKBP-type peptidyl-prolyl cis-trans isomerase